MTVGNDSGSFTAASTSDDSTSSGAKDQAKQAAGTAAQESQHVAGVAKGEAQKVTAEARTQARQLLGEATSQVEDQTRTQRDRLVDSLRTVGDDLEKMAGNADGGIAADLVHEVADRARSLTASLDGREPRELLEDVRRYARRKPGTFLLGALAAGVVAGRLTRGAKAASSDSSTGGTTPAYGTGTLPSAGTTDSSLRGHTAHESFASVDPMIGEQRTSDVFADPSVTDPQGVSPR